MAAYCAVSDLLTGDLRIGPRVDAQVYVDAAAEEMDARLGLVYELPITGAADHSVKLLKRINALIATARLILAVALAGEDNRLQRYGASLLREGQTELDRIVSGELPLEGCPLRADQLQVRGPSIKNPDAESPFGVFDAFAMRGESVYWQPGE